VREEDLARRAVLDEIRAAGDLRRRAEDGGGERERCSGNDQPLHGARL
jgi:hypothetical protein